VKTDGSAAVDNSGLSQICVIFCTVAYWPNVFMLSSA